ncbi:ATP synthase F1 subunit gamma [Candidatus Woesebacteria bacterium RIFCSPLOWO2_01_FULL_39_21]|uniref:ATP synthase gamma chain n=1 Tax=Candidatus Woesebacteria bacterium RIFCSPLOWO2_01_FULL_39_21 TaxID=1802519 RepID=A0A1F8BLY8_9BACT|nr:MAG: ATP synthase F1 subunit gamma [Candidatus Woesebacteria bacterium RIFCSPLOWO2_01_FULL_39_21]
MENPRLIKKRIQSVKNIRKITKALEMVSASKVRASQIRARAGKPYSQKVYELVSELSGKADGEKIDLFEKGKGQKRLYILVSTNKGLCGSLNTNLFRSVMKDTGDISKEERLFVTVGKKAVSFALANGTLIADFSDVLKENALAAIISLVVEEFKKGNVSKVYIAYSDFVNALTQIPQLKKLLPISRDNLLVKDESSQIYIFEPEAKHVLEMMLPFYLEVQLKGAFLESEASEHSARMLAMKSASDNAYNLSEALNLVYNEVRQQTITDEIADVTRAMEVM